MVEQPQEEREGSSPSQDFAASYPWQASVWVRDTDPSAWVPRGHWMEEARCSSRQRADEVAISLSLRHPLGVRVARLSSSGEWETVRCWGAIPSDISAQKEAQK